MHNKSGFNKLARVIQGRTKQILNNSGVTVDLGTIQADFSLVTDSYDDMAIPPSDYLISEQLTITDEILATTDEGGLTPHAHAVKTPAKLQSVKPGDRVLVNWIGSDAVVVAKIKPGTEAMV